MTQNELMLVVKQFNDEHKGKLTAMLIVTDLVKESRDTKKRLREYDKRRKASISMDKVRTMFPKLKFGETIHDGLRDVLQSFVMDGRFLLDVSVDIDDFDYSINFTTLSKGTYLDRMLPKVDITDDLTKEQFVDFLTKLEKLI